MRQNAVSLFKILSLLSMINLDLLICSVVSDKENLCPPYSLIWLAIGVRSHHNIKGIKIGHLESRVSLYADDTLLCLADPEDTVPPLVDFIKSFGELSGHTINWGKSEFMPLSV